MKEAAYKALYPTVKPTWKELSFTSFNLDISKGKPMLLYKPFNEGTNCPEKLGALHASISHEDNYVVAMVVAEAPN